MASTLSFRRLLAASGIVLTLLLIAAAGWWLLGGQDNGPGIHVAIDQLPDTLNPVFPQNPSAVAADDLIWNGLFGKGGHEDLAAGVAMVAGDNHKWKVTLREVFWQDGRAVDSRDVEFSLQAYLDLANRSPLREYFDNFVESFQTLDQRTVEFVFRQPIPEFRVRKLLTFPLVPSQLEGHPLSTDLSAGERERSLSVKPIGTGPFRVVDWTIGRSIRFAANPKFHGSMPAAPFLTLHQVFDPVQRRQGWEDGRYQIVPLQDPLDLGPSSGTAATTWSSRSFFTVLFNTRDPSLADRGVRAQLAGSVDPARLLKELGVDFPVNTGVYPQDLFSRTLKDYAVKPFVSRPRPSSAPAPSRLVLLVSEEQRAFAERLGQGIAAAWKQLGTSVVVKVLRQDTLEEVLSRGDYQAALVNLRGFDSLYSGLFDVFSSGGNRNWTGLRDQAVDRVLATLNRESDANVWIPAAAELQRRLDAVVPAVWLFSAPSGALVRGVGGFLPDGDRIFLGAEAWRGGRP